MLATFSHVGGFEQARESIGAWGKIIEEMVVVRDSNRNRAARDYLDGQIATLAGADKVIGEFNQLKRTFNPALDDETDAIRRTLSTSGATIGNILDHDARSMLMWIDSGEFIPTVKNQETVNLFKREVEIIRSEASGIGDLSNQVRNKLAEIPAVIPVPELCRPDQAVILYRENYDKLRDFLGIIQTDLIEKNYIKNGKDGGRSDKNTLAHGDFRKAMDKLLGDVFPLLPKTEQEANEEALKKEDPKTQFPADSNIEQIRNDVYLDTQGLDSARAGFVEKWNRVSVWRGVAEKYVASVRGYGTRNGRYAQGP